MKTTITKLFSLLNKKEIIHGIFIIFGTIFGSLLEVAALGAIVPLIAVLGQPNPSDVHPLIEKAYDFLGNPSRIEFAVYGLFSISLLFVLKSVYMAIIYLISERYVWRLRERISKKLISNYVGMDHQYYLTRNSTELVTHVTGDTSSITHGTNSLIILISDLIFLLAVVALLIRTDPTIAAGGLGLIVLGAGLFYRFIRNKSQTWGEISQQGEHSRRKYARYSLEGLKELKVSGKQEFFVDKFVESSGQAARALGNSAYIGKISRPWLETIAVIGLLILAVAFLNIGRTFTTLLPMLTMVAAIGLRSLPAVSRILTALQRIKVAGPYVSVINRELTETNDQSIHPAHSSGDSSITSPFDNLEIDDVSFSYDTRPNVKVLQNIDFTVSKGEQIGIIGESGSGKSTLVDIILGLLTPLDGEIKVNGIPIRTGMESWLKKVGYLPQNVFIYDDSIAANIALGDTDETWSEERIIEVLKEAQLYDFVHQLPEGINTVIGEAGTRISGGQRQRLGIARLLYSDSEVLILDEPTASLDQETAIGFWNALTEQENGKTMIVVSHDMSIISKCDKTYRIKDSGIILDT